MKDYILMMYYNHLKYNGLQKMVDDGSGKGGGKVYPKLKSSIISYAQMIGLILKYKVKK